MCINDYETWHSHAGKFKKFHHESQCDHHSFTSLKGLHGSWVIFREFSRGGIDTREQLVLEIIRLSQPFGLERSNVCMQSLRSECKLRMFYTEQVDWTHQSASWNCSVSSLWSYPPNNSLWGKLSCLLSKRVQAHIPRFRYSGQRWTQWKAKFKSGLHA